MAGGSGYFSWQMHSGLSFRFPRHTFGFSFWYLPNPAGLIQPLVAFPQSACFLSGSYSTCPWDHFMVAIADAGWQEQLVLPRWGECPGPFSVGGNSDLHLCLFPLGPPSLTPTGSSRQAELLFCHLAWDSPVFSKHSFLISYHWLW